jgi:outer membrane protein assembly factor BamB
MSRVRPFLFAAVLVSALSVFAQAEPALPDTAVFRGGPARAGLYLASPPLTEPVRAWNADTPRPNRTTPALATLAGTRLVFYGNEDGTLYAADAATGALVWEHRFSGSVVSTAAIVGSRLFVGSLNGSVYALDAATGAELWAFATGDDVYSSPVVREGVVFIASLDGRLYALDAATGAERWSLPFNGQVWSSPALVSLTDGEGAAVMHVIAAGRGGDVRAADAETGTLVWRFEAGGFDATPALLVASDAAIEAGVAATGTVDAATGAGIVPATGAGVVPATGAGVVPATVFIPSYDGNLYALDAATGAERWRFAMESAVYASAAVLARADAPRVFAVSYDGLVFAIDAARGVEIWRADVGGPAYASPTVVYDAETGAAVVLVVTERGGLMHALDAETGAALWAAETGGQGDWRSSSAVADAGWIYVGSDRDGIIAYRIAPDAD